MAVNNSKRLGGIAECTIDGVSVALAEGVMYSVSSVRRESLIGLDGLHGYAETVVPGHIKMTLRDAGTLTVADFNAMTKSTVQLRLANGKGILGSGLWTTEIQEVRNENGTFELTWEGDQISELVS